MKWIERFRIHRAARRFAKHLPSALSKGWGRSEFYTPGQVETALKGVGLDEAYSVIAYAAFLTEADFNAHTVPQAELPYEVARILFFRYAHKRSVGKYAHDPITETESISRYGP